MLGTLLTWLVGCTGVGPVPLPAPLSTAVGPTWSDVAPSLERCAECHRDGGLAFSLSTWRDAAPRAAQIADAVAAKRMPPWPAVPADVEYVDDPSLDAGQIAQIVAWADAGAPVGDADPDAAFPVPPAERLPRVDAQLAMPEPYAPLGDEHRCFVLDRATLTAPFLTGVDVRPSNDAVAHHLFLTAILPDGTGDDPLTADLADPGPGFDCSVITLAAFPGPSKVLGGWLPGRGPAVFPEQTGIAIDPAAQIVLEAHYYTPEPAGADATTIDLMTADSVRAPAVEVKVSHPDWALHRGIAVHAHDTETHKLKTTVGVEAGDAVDLSRGLNAYWVLPHMHGYGVSISLEVVHDGQSTVLVDIPAWDYDWQLTYWFAEPVPLEADDELRLICVHENPTDEDVWWGETFEDEMCVARLFVAPRG